MHIEGFPLNGGFDRKNRPFHGLLCQDGHPTIPHTLRFFQVFSRGLEIAPNVGRRWAPTTTLW